MEGAALGALQLHFAWQVWHLVSFYVAGAALRNTSSEVRGRLATIESFGRRLVLIDVFVDIEFSMH